MMHLFIDFVHPFKTMLIELIYLMLCRALGRLWLMSETVSHFMELLVYYRDRQTHKQFYKAIKYVLL